MAFAPIAMLNDPFESSIENTLAYSKNLRLPPPYIQPIKKIKLGNMIDYAVNPLYDEHAKGLEKENKSIEELNRWLNRNIELLEKARVELGILSLSGNFLNVLMWAHYAENHKGICIGFHSSDACFKPASVSSTYPDTLFDIDKVSYQSSRPNFEFMPTAAYLKRAFFTKHELWQYEEEYRLLRTLNRRSEILIEPFPLSAIAVIYLGLNISGERREKVLSLTESLRVPIYQIRHREDSYELEAKVVRAGYIVDRQVHQ